MRALVVYWGTVFCVSVIVGALTALLVDWFLHRRK